ncbi:MAG: ATP-binding protein [Candidatus Thiodiazotropha sp.]
MKVSTLKTTTKERINTWLRSIKAKTGVALFVIIMGVLGLFGVYQYLNDESAKTKDLEELSSRTISRLAEQLVLPLWEVDNLWVRKIIKSEMSDKRIFAISVVAEGGIVEGLERNADWQLVDVKNDISGDYIHKTMDVFREEEKIGSVKLWITKQFMHAELKREAWELLLAVTVFSAICIFIVSGMLHRFVIQPVNHILGIAEAIAEGEYEQEIKIEQKDEIGILGRGFNSMQAKIRQREAERDRYEIKLRDSEQALRSLSENSPDVIVRHDREGRYIYINPKFEQINHLKAEQVYGKKPSELSSDLAPQDDGFTNKLMQAMDSGTITKADLSWIKDGKLVYWYVRIVPELDAHGDVVSALAIWSDITERKQAEKELHDSEELLRTTLENAPVVLYRLDSEGVFQLSMGTGLAKLGFKPGEVVGQSIFELYKDFPDIAANHRDALAGKAGRYTAEVSGIHFDSSIIPLMDEENKVRAVIGVAVDITDKKRAEDELLRLKDSLEEKVQQRTAELVLARDAAETANKAKSVFLANMSHELRTPLNAILGFSSMMRKDPLLPEHQQQNIDIINRSGEHLLSLINDVLEMAKIEAGRMQLQNAPFDLGSVVRDITDMMTIRAKSKGLQLVLEQSSQFPRYIAGDEARMRQILINLLSNAIKYTHEGSVTLRLWVEQKKLPRLQIEVEDTGIGMTPDDQKHIFESFMQLGKQVEHTGTGLGLAITRQFVQMMGGKISLDSTPGKGSVFLIDLPLIEVQESEIPNQNQSDRGDVIGLAPGQGEYRILIVEDQRENQLLLTRLMEVIGCKVKLAENGEQGIELFKSWKPHLIWMDRRMPVMDGMEATRRIRKLPEGKEVKIVAVTASAFGEQRDEMLNAGMNDYVRKPYQAGEVYECLSKHLGVKYLYQDASVSREQEVILTSEMFEALPETLCSEIVRALESLDIKRIEAVIGQVAEYDEALQKKLNQLAKNFDYPIILHALRKDSR